VLDQYPSPDSQGTLVQFQTFPTYEPARIGQPCLWPDAGVIHRS
jgi:hypothetical protein